MVNESFLTQPGLIFGAFYFTAGMTLIGFIQGIILASVLRQHLFFYLFYALLCLDVSFAQISLAQYHSSETLAAAINAQKWVTTFAFLFLPMVYGWINSYADTRIHWGRIAAISMVALGLIVFNFYEPYGVRYETLTSTEVISFPFNEKLLLIRGEPNVASYPSRLLFVITFAWIFMKGVQLVLKKQIYPGYILILGSVMLFFSAFISGLIDHGKVNSVYLAGYGFIVFMLLISILVSKEWLETKTQVSRLTFYDSLTGLPNKTLLKNRLTQALRKPNNYCALLLLEIDRYKAYIAAHGHSASEELLIAVANQVSKQLSLEDTVAHFDSDQFVILLPNAGPTRQDAFNLAFKTASLLQSELQISDLLTSNDQTRLTFSFGIEVGSDIDIDSISHLLHRTETALHSAKEMGAGSVGTYDPNFSELAKSKFELENLLSKAVSEDQLRLYLQSKVDSNGQMIGAEALLRWEHPEKGLLPPNLFIPVAEESRLIVSLSEWVFEEGLRLLTLPEIKNSSMNISVNLSPKHFAEEQFVPWLKGLLSSYDVDPQQLTIEVTETLMITNIDQVISKIHEISEMGIRFSIDDFGTGYSSLAYIKSLPIQELKIDRAFIKDLPDDLEDVALVKAIVSIAKHLQLKIVAEGVETLEHKNFLNALDDSMIHQGYYYGRPEPLGHWLDRLKTA